MYETFSRGLRIFQVVEENEYKDKSGHYEMWVRLRDIDTAHMLPSWHLLQKTGMEEPRGFSFYDLLNFGRFPPYMLIAPRDVWASQFTCPKHGMCTEAMVTTKKTCAVDAKNGQCDEPLIRERTERLVQESDD